MPRKYPVDRPFGSADGRCNATSKSTGERCKLDVALGARLCRYHFGNSAREKKIALVNREKMNLSHELMSSIEVVDESPNESLLRMVRTASRTEQVLSQYIAAKNSDDISDVKVGFYVDRWNEERDRLAKFSEMAIRNGCSAKVVEAAQNEGRAIVDILFRLINHPELGLTTEQHKTAKKLLSRLIDNSGVIDV